MCLVKFSFTSLADCPVIFGLSWWYIVKEFTCNAEDAGGTSLVPGSGRSPREGNGRPLQVFLPGNPMVGYSPWGPKRVGQDLTPKQQLVIFCVVQKYVSFAKIQNYLYLWLKIINFETAISTDAPWPPVDGILWQWWWDQFHIRFEFCILFLKIPNAKWFFFS